MAKASSLVGISLMPITEAATSMSRTAIQARPVDERTMFLAASAITTTMESTSRYFSTGVFSSCPKMISFWVEITPDDELFDSQGNLVRHQTMKNWAARVATAR